MKRATTSASNVFRRRDCLGSAAMEAQFTEQDSEYSTEGTMMHSLFLTGERPDTLTAEQVSTLNLADFYAEEFFDNCRAMFEIPDGTPCFDEREVRMMLHDTQGRPLYPGGADIIRTWKGFNYRAIIDVKYGYMEVPMAADNTQLASYYAMRQQQSSAIATAVAICQPRNFGPRLTQAAYSAADLPAVVAELTAIVRASEQPNAPLTASEEACRFCRARTACPAYREKFAVIQTIEHTAIQSLDTDDLATVFEVIRRAKKIDKEVTAEVRARIERGEFPGYKLANSGDDVTLNDAMEFFFDLQSAMPEGVALTATEFDSCREVRWGDLTTLVQTKLKVSEKRAKEIIRDVSAPYVTRTPKQMKVVRDKTKALE